MRGSRQAVTDGEWIERACEMGKLSLLGVAKGYGRTLKDYRTNRLSIADISIQVFAPLAIGAVSFTCRMTGSSPINGIGDELISGVSIVSALLCGVSIMAFQLRVQIASDGRVKLTEKDTSLLDGLFYDVTWAVVVGFSATLVIICSKYAPEPSIIRNALSSASLALLLNFILVTCMSTKRLCAAYELIARI